MRRIVFACLILCPIRLPALAQEERSGQPDSMTCIHPLQADTLKADQTKGKRKKLIRGYVGGQLEELNNIDTTYITPNLYNFAFMVQNTNTFESFTLRGEQDGQKQLLRFAPNPTLRLGGYFGWRWIFLGYTFDVGGLFGGKKNKSKKTEFDLSLYSSKVGVDVFYRKTGNDFRIKEMEGILAPEEQNKYQIDENFSGLDIYSKGVNVYYLFNHRHFSYPAAFSQSTVQRRSCGSFKLGFSYSYHRICFDHIQLPQPIQERMNDNMKFDRVEYSDYSINFGYAYNWVFRRNMLICISFSPAIAYTHSHLKQDGESGVSLGDLKFKNINIDFIGRLGIVYNNTKYFAGLSVIAHSFDYKKERFSINNSFGSINFYVGFNFKRKKEYQAYE